jgi:hypothetical protein
LRTLAVPLVLLGAAVLAAPVAADPKPYAPPKPASVLFGVRIQEVDWPKLCASVRPLTLSRAGVTCSRVHPASDFGRPISASTLDYSGLTPEKAPPRCDYHERKFADWTSPKNEWSECIRAFRHALATRSRENYTDMPFDEWRTKYFGPWLAKGAK